jgi:hypothetical protein
MRRWSSAAYHPGMAAPFLAPEIVAAAFAVSPEQKATKTLHLAMLDRLVPEWSDVPYVSAGTGRNVATRIWDGDGLATLKQLAARPAGALASLIDHEAVRRAVAEAAASRPASGTAKVLEQYVTLAVADAGYGTGPVLPHPSTTSASTPSARRRASIRRTVRMPTRLRRMAKRAQRRLT